MGSGVGGDNAAPRGGGPSLPQWSPDGKSLIDVVGKQGSAILVSVNAANGAVAELTADKQAVMAFNVSTDDKRILALISTPINIGDLFVVAPDRSKQQTQLTHVNETLFSQLNLTMPEDIMVTPTVNAKDIDNHPIETWVQRPPDFDPAKKYPLILDIHGGPHSAYGWVFDHEFQWFAAKGYVVVYPNPRGSTTYGQKFANVIQYNYPGDDFHDLMDAVDAVVKLGYIEPGKLGVTGGSGGGLLTDWTVTQTNRFKAAVAQRDITDWTNWWYTDDFTLFQPTWFKGAPFEQTEEFKRALAAYLRRKDPNSNDVHPRRGRLSHSANLRRGSLLSRPEISPHRHRNGPLSRREPRTLAQRAALASRRAAGKYRKLVRQVSDGQAGAAIQRRASGSEVEKLAIDLRAADTPGVPAVQHG